MTSQPEPSSLHSKRLPREQLPAEHTRYTLDLPTLLDRHDMIWGDPQGPPADWRAGAPIGNGDFGAMIYGYPDAMGFVLGKSDVWNRRNDDRSEFIGETFSAYRQTFFDDDEAGFETLRDDAKPSYRKDSPHLTTCGRFVLHLEEAAIIASCTLRTHLREGLAALSWREPNSETKVRALISRRFEVLTVDVKRQGDARVDEAIPWELSRAKLPENPAVEAIVDNGVCYLTQRFAAGGGYTVAVTALTGGCAAEVRDGRLWGKFMPDPEGALAVMLTIVSSEDAPDTEAEALRRLQRAKEAGPQLVAEEHSEWWQEYWKRGLASVGDPEVERLYYTSLYLTASTLQAGKQSPGLQGIWVGENVPPWNADFHSNVNIQCVYWGLFTNNRLDLVEPYLRHYHRTAAAARRDAAEYFQMRGLRFPHGGSIGGNETTQPDYQTLGTDPSASSWVTQLFWQYYEYSQDRSFLEEVAYPLLRDVALFFTDYLIWDEEQQHWIIAPSVHFEARGKDFGAWGRNSLYAQAMFRSAFARAIAAAGVLGQDEELVDEWSQRLAQLAPLPLTAEGDWKAWEDQEPYYPNHNYLLPIAFPAELVSQWHGPTDWLEQARRTWEHLEESQDTCFSGELGFGGQGVCELLRIGEIEAAFERARLPEDENAYCRNGAVRLWQPGIFQMDQGPGMCRILADMMLLGLDEVIHLFPGIPQGVPARFHSLRAPGAFLVSAEKRSDDVDYALVRSLAGGMLRLTNPWPDKTVAAVSLTDGQTSELARGALLEVETRAIADYLLRPAETALERVSVQDFAIFG
jgi:hypothetical protein